MSTHLTGIGRLYPTPPRCLQAVVHGVVLEGVQLVDEECHLSVRHLRDQGRVELRAGDGVVDLSFVLRVCQPHVGLVHMLSCLHGAKLVPLFHLLP